MAKILFLSSGVFENLSIEYLSAVLKKNGHEVSLLLDPLLFQDTFHSFSPLNKILDYKKNIRKEAKNRTPDLICFSVLTDNYQWALRVASELKQHIDTPIIFGGIHPTLVPELVIKNESVDMICRGEGEYALLELANEIDEGRFSYEIENIWFKKNDNVIKNNMRPLCLNLDEIPFPDKSVFYDIYKGYSKEYFIISGRGCPFQCSYCCNHAVNRLYGSSFLRKRSVSNVIEELIVAKEKYKMRYVWFIDDLLTMNNEWLREFSESYRRQINIPFFCYIHPEMVNEELSVLLKKAGCYEVGIGVQTLSVASRQAVRRFESIEKINSAINLVKQHQMLVVTENIVGLPYQDRDNLLDLAKFYNRNRPDIVIMNWLRLFPKTDIVKMEKDAGLISDQDIVDLEDGLDISVGWKKNINDYHSFKKLVLLLEVLPCLPKRLVSVLIDKKLFRFLFGWFKVFVYFLRIIHYSCLGSVFFANKTYDSGARIYVRAYFYFFVKKLFFEKKV